MKILCVTPWRNTWIDYWTKFLQSRGHQVQWHVSSEISLNDINPKLVWADKVLCHWADKWAQLLSQQQDIKLYVILRSYEIFQFDAWCDLSKIKWENVRQLFMLNEAHFYPFSCRVKGVKPVFFKNGVDLEEWTPAKKKASARNKLAFICGVNQKKGIELVVQSVHELNKVNSGLTLEHIGQNEDLRRWYYLECVMPHLKTKWFNHGYENSHKFVQRFLSDKGFIISSSIAEGCPMNILEAMASGVIPLVHTWPGSEFQFPKEYLWTTFDDLRRIYKRCIKNMASESKKVRKLAETRYDYRKTYLPVAEIMESAK
jgi:glycosyltransferase involved in cell wall biosynthesis